MTLVRSSWLIQGNKNSTRYNVKRQDRCTLHLPCYGAASVRMYVTYLCAHLSTAGPTSPPSSQAKGSSLSSSESVERKARMNGGAVRTCTETGTVCTCVRAYKDEPQRLSYRLSFLLQTKHLAASLFQRTANWSGNCRKGQWHVTGRNAL